MNECQLHLLILVIPFPTWHAVRAALYYPPPRSRSRYRSSGSLAPRFHYLTPMILLAQLILMILLSLEQDHENVEQDSLVQLIFILFALIILLREGFSDVLSSFYLCFHSLAPRSHYLAPRSHFLVPRAHSSKLYSRLLRA